MLVPNRNVRFFSLGAVAAVPLVEVVLHHIGLLHPVALVQHIEAQHVRRTRRGTIDDGGAQEGKTFEFMQIGAAVAAEGDGPKTQAGPYQEGGSGQDHA